MEEFRIETAAFKAENSHASGGMISMVTKSGANQLHGSLFDHYQTQRLDANSWLPRAEMKTGDFSRWRLANGALIPIYDPTSTRANSHALGRRHQDPLRPHQHGLAEHRTVYAGPECAGRVGAQL